MQRSPRGDLPHLRAMFVVMPVSSMKISFAGSRDGRSAAHAARAAATSGRCCSAACAVFFIGHLPAVKEAPQRADAHTRAAACEFVLKFSQRDVACLGDLAENKIRLSLNAAGFAVTADGQGRHTTGAAHLRLPTDRTRGADLETYRRRAARKTLRYGRANALPQINRNRLDHGCRPPSPANILNQIKTDLGIPPDSMRWEAALAKNVQPTQLFNAR